MAENEEADCPNNIRLFRIAISNSLKNIAESVSEEKFIEILTTLKFNRSTARRLHKAMIEELYNSMNDDLEDMLKEGSLQDALIKVARLSEENITCANEDTWRPSGNVTSHLRALDARELEVEIEELEKQVNEMEEKKGALMETIARDRSRIRASNDSVTSILDRAPAALQRLEKTYVQLMTCFRATESE